MSDFCNHKGRKLTHDYLEAAACGKCASMVRIPWLIARIAELEAQLQTMKEDRDAHWQACEELRAHSEELAQRLDAKAQPVSDAPNAKLERFGWEWTGPKDFVAKPMPDGYWTPWHIAQQSLTSAEVTPEMVEAGCCAVSAEQWFQGDVNDTVASVYKAMRRAALQEDEL